MVLEQSKGKVQGIRVTGHAMAGKPGEDIVCAAVSVLTQTILLGIMEALERQIPYERESGNLSFRVPKELSDQEVVKVDTLMNTLRLGMKNLKEGYEKFIDVRTVDINKEEV